MSAGALQDATAVAVDDDMKEVATLADGARVFFSQVSPKLMFAAGCSTAVLRLSLGPLTAFDLGAAAATIIFYWVFEWAAHVVLLHGKPREVLGRTVDPLYAKYHRAHHREPWRLRWVLVPSRFIALAFVATGALALFVAPSRPLGVTAWSVFCFYALSYEWTHFLVHTRYKPRSAFFREIWRNHRLHHFKNEDYWFGLSVTLADSAFGTAPAASEVPTSNTTRTLGVEEEP